LPAALLTVGPVDFHHRHPDGLKVSGQPGPVGAGAFDPDSLDGAESSQPVHQRLVAGRCGGKLLDAEQPGDVVQRGRHMDLQVGIHAASHSPVLNNGHRCPFSIDG
jgi:hypothetical protein